MFAQTARNYGNFHNQLVLETGRNANEKNVFTPMLLFCRGDERNGKKREGERNEICKNVQIRVNFLERIFLLGSII